MTLSALRTFFACMHACCVLINSVATNDDDLICMHVLDLPRHSLSLELPLSLFSLCVQVSCINGLSKTSWGGRFRQRRLIYAVGAFGLQRVVKASWGRLLFDHAACLSRDHDWSVLHGRFSSPDWCT